MEWNGGKMRQIAQMELTREWEIIVFRKKMMKMEWRLAKLPEGMWRTPHCLLFTWLYCKIWTHSKWKFPLSIIVPFQQKRKNHLGNFLAIFIFLQIVVLLDFWYYNNKDLDCWESHPSSIIICKFASEEANYPFANSTLTQCFLQQVNFPQATSHSLCNFASGQFMCTFCLHSILLPAAAEFPLFISCVAKNAINL
jgi:hypothetical protein